MRRCHSARTALAAPIAATSKSRSLKVPRKIPPRQRASAARLGRGRSARAEPPRSRVLASARRCETGCVPNELPELTVADASAWGAWLTVNHDSSAGVWLVLAKQGTSEPTTLASSRRCRRRSAWLDRRAGETTRRGHLPPALHAATATQSLVSGQRRQGRAAPGRRAHARRRSRSGRGSPGGWSLGAGVRLSEHYRGARRPGCGAHTGAPRAGDVRDPHEPEPLRRAATCRRGQAQRHAPATNRAVRGNARAR